MRIILALLAITAASAQRLEFEVASVKPSVNAPFGGNVPIPGPVAESMGFEGGPGSQTPGRIHYSGVTLKMILVRAYATRPYQISGPGWMETERYDIDAKYPAETKAEEFRLMLQTLLAERFHLAVHRETREMSRYRLVVAKGGPKLSPAQKLPEYKDDEERKAAMQKQTRANMEAMMRRPHSGPYRRFGSLNATMAKLAENLSGYVDRPVTDDTGLEGSYSYTLEWSPEPSAAAVENSLPSIFAAVQEQLGLKLEPEKGPVEFLVIDRAEKTPVVN
ncbi:MAG TPA: TIGR03435 family protein [Bryobacteraceae bacterium]|jgi:uncharacterized protein (TIGR03435 family)